MRWNNHQTPAHVIVPNDGQQAAMQDGDLFAQHPSDSERRFDQDSQIGEVLDQLLDARLGLYAHPASVAVSMLIAERRVASGFPGSIVNDYGDGSSCHGSRVSEMRYRFRSCP